VRAAWLVVAATAVTAIFDLITNLATGWIYGQLVPTLIGGIPFSLLHIASNVALFAALGTPLVAVFAHYRARLSA
jgi:hypothetical protein